MMSRQYVRALYDFPQPEPGEIPLKIGDIVEVTGRVNPDWLTGKIGPKTGNFPAAFVSFVQLPKVGASEKIFAAIDHFPSNVDGDLTFKKGDIIIGIEPIDGNWWHGQLETRVGIFPVTLVKQLETDRSPGVVASPTKTPTQSQKPVASKPSPAQPVVVVNRSQSNGVAKPVHNYNNNNNVDGFVLSRANTDMKAQISEELSFKKGDTVTILRAEDEDFYLGECNGRRGSFPIYFVDVLEKEKFERIRYKGPQSRTLTRFGMNAKYVPPSKELSGDFTSGSSNLTVPDESYASQPNSIDSNASCESNAFEHSNGEAPGRERSASFKTETLRSHDDGIDAYGRSLYPFVGQSRDELTFLDNEIITLIRHVDDQWTYGRIDDIYGIFPTSFVEIVVDCPSETNGRKPEFNGATVEVRVEPSSRRSSTPVVERTGIVIASYTIVGEDDLAVNEGDTVSVLEVQDENWCRVRAVDGSEGYVPSSFIQILDSQVKDVSEDCVASAEVKEKETIKPDRSPKPQLRPKPPGKTFIHSGRPGSSLRGVSLDEVIGMEIEFAKRSSGSSAGSGSGRSSFGLDTGSGSGNSSCGLESSNTVAQSMSSGLGLSEKDSLEWTLTSQSLTSDLGRSVSHMPGAADLSLGTKLHTEAARTCSAPDDAETWAPPSYESLGDLASSWPKKTAAPPRPAAPTMRTLAEVATSVKRARRPAPRPPTRKTAPNLSETGAGFSTSLTDVGDTADTACVITDLKSRIREIERDLQNCRMSKTALSDRLERTDDEQERADIEQNVEFYSANIDGLTAELQSLNKSLHHLEPEEADNSAPKPSSGAATPAPDPGAQLESLRAKHREKRENIIRELLTTEDHYLHDLKLVTQTFLAPSAAKCAHIDTDTLFGNIDEVTQLSAELLQRLETAVNGVEFDQQTIGPCFNDLKQRMTEVYSLYCRNHDDVIALLDKYEGNEEIDEFINKGVEAMKRETTVFDLGSLLIKPVQRILKYPLLLNELMKCTEDGHPDKSHVVQAIGAMTDVAQAINEYKRRKDLVYKYRKDSEVSLSNRISKINLHSLRKKSSRVSTRLSKSLGIATSTRDQAFDLLEMRFRSVEKAVKLFVRDVGVYTEQSKECWLLLENCGSDIRDYYMEKSALTDQVDRYQNALSIIAITQFEKFLAFVKAKVLEPLTTLMALFQGPNNLIRKRFDKLLDYDHLTSSIRKIRDQEQLRIARDNLELAKKTYGALNSQLLDELPRLCSLSTALFDDCVRNFVKAQQVFMESARREFDEIVKLPIFQGINEENCAEQFAVRYWRQVDQLADLSFVPKNFSPMRSEPAKADKSASKVLRRHSTKPKSELDAKLAPSADTRRRSGIQANHELEVGGQSESQIQYLRAKYSSDQLYRVTTGHVARLSHELSMSAGHAVAVVKRGDPMGGKDLWFVDNGVVKGFVPSAILSPLVTTAFVRRSTESAVTPVTESQTSWYETLSQPTPSLVETPGDVASVKKGNSTSAQVAADAITPSQQPSRSDNLPAALPTAQYQNLPTTPSKQTPTPRVRPPNQRQSSNDLLTEALDNLLIDEDVAPSSSVQTDTTLQYFEVLYDFKARNRNEMDIARGESLLVLQKHDHDGNAEWWLAEKDGTRGFVPANYLHGAQS